MKCKCVSQAPSGSTLYTDILNVFPNHVQVVSNFTWMCIYVLFAPTFNHLDFYSSLRLTIYKGTFSFTVSNGFFAKSPTGYMDEASASTEALQPPVETPNKNSTGMHGYLENIERHGNAAVFSKQNVPFSKSASSYLKNFLWGCLGYLLEMKPYLVLWGLQ